MPQHLVSLTFDFDAVSLWIAQGQTTPTAISRGEFGVVGARRLLASLRRYDIHATWYVPGHTVDTYPDVVREIAAAGHEIGHHGYDHLTPVSMTRSEECEQLERGNEAIERVVGSRAVGYRSPAWDLSVNSVDLLLEQGFVYDSSLMGHDYEPYRARRPDIAELGRAVQFGETTELWELPISWSLDDFPQFEYFRGRGALNAGSAVLENWWEDYLYLTEQPSDGVITYTCHPFVIGRGHRMRMFDRLLGRLNDHGAVFVTAHEALAQLGCVELRANRHVLD